MQGPESPSFSLPLVNGVPLFPVVLGWDGQPGTLGTYLAVKIGRIGTHQYHTFIASCHSKVVEINKAWLVKY